MDATNAIVVPVVIVIMQSIKILDKNDKLKRVYGAMALILSVLGGFGYSYLIQGASVNDALLAAAVTYGAVQGIWVAKEASGVKILGDVGTQAISQDPKAP